MGRLTGLVVALAVAGSLVLASWAQAAEWELKTVSLPSGGKEGVLWGVSCFSASVCTGVGDYWNGSVWGASGNEWNGTSWATASVIANPSPGEKNGDLRSVSCFSATRCIAAGAFGVSGVGLSLIESSNKGTWTHTTSPNPSNGKNAELLGILCMSLEFCLTTGQFLNTEGGGEKGAIMAEEWEGTSWSLLSPIENPGNRKNGKLRSVACTAVSECRAVGNWGIEVGGEGLGTPGEETWNGSTWKATETPVPSSAHFGELFGISCATANSCLAVGSWEQVITKAYNGLANYWNGTSWSLLEPPAPTGATREELAGVSCTAVEECMVVGTYTSSTGTKMTLAELWKSKVWKIQPTPNPAGAKASGFESVSCTEAEVCNAVGFSVNSSNVELPIAAHL